MYEAQEINFSKVQELLPEPAGYRILIACPVIEEKTEGGIIRPDELLDKEKVASIVGLVVKLGKDAYRDQNKFPNGPWCKEGEWVMFRSYAGIRMNLNGHEFRMINDDTVEGVVPDPRVLKRAW